MKRVKSLLLIAKIPDKTSMPSPVLTYVMDSHAFHDSLQSLTLVGLKLPVAFGRSD